MILIDHSMGVRSVGLDALAHGKKFWRALVWLASTMISTSRGGPTPTPTCPPGQGGSAYADGASSEATKREKRRPSRETEGFLSSASVIDPRTIQAYLETEYRAHGEPGFTLRVGQASADLLSAHKRQKADCSAFLTACNPFSESFDEAANAARQAALAKELSGRSLVFLPGIGQHPSNRWPGEDSFLVFGLTLEAAKVLGARFEQNGFVWSGADAVPQLILLR
jgi:hypothetical protein